MLASVVAHVALAVVVMLQRPTLTIPVEDAGPPQAIIPILIMPKAMPAEAGAKAPPTAIRLHRRKQRFVLAKPPPPPVVIPSPPRPAALAPPLASASPVPRAHDHVWASRADRATREGCNPRTKTARDCARAARCLG